MEPWVYMENACKVQGLNYAKEHNEKRETGKKGKLEKGDGPERAEEKSKRTAGTRGRGRKKRTRAVTVAEAKKAAADEMDVDEEARINMDDGDLGNSLSVTPENRDEGIAQGGAEDEIPGGVQNKQRVSMECRVEQTHGRNN